MSNDQLGGYTKFRMQHCVMSRLAADAGYTALEDLLC